MKKSYLLLFLFVLLVLFFAGCSSSGYEKLPPTVKGEIVFYNTMSPYELTVFKEALRPFQKKYPNVTVKIVEVPFYDMKKKFLKVAKTYECPDIVRIDKYWIAQIAEKNLLMSLDNFGIKALEVDKIIDTVRKNCIYKGKYVAIPQGIDCLALFYNKEILKKHSLSVPDNFDAFKKVAKKLTDPTKGIYGFFFYPDAWYFEPFLYAFGGRYFDSNGKLVINSDNTKKAFQFVKDLKKQGILPPIKIRNKAYDMMIQSFKSGKIAMIFTGPWAITNILKGSAFKNNLSNLGIAPVPRGSHGSYSPIGGQYLAIPKNARHSRLAFELLKFMNSADFLTTMAVKAYNLPARRDIYTKKQITENPYIASFLFQFDDSSMVDASAQRIKLYPFVSKLLKQYINDEIRLDYLLKDIENKWKTLKK